MKFCSDVDGCHHLTKMDKNGGRRHLEFILNLEFFKNLF